MATKKTIIVDPKAQILNAGIQGANGILYQDVDILEHLYNSLASYMITGKTDGQSKVSQIIQKDFDKIERSGEKDIRHLQALMDITEKVQTHFDKKKATDKDFIEYLLRKNLFHWQQQVYDDGSKKLCLICGRRSGKSYADADLMLKHCNVGYDNIEVDGRIVRKPRSAVYIGLTLQKAANNMWQLLKDEISRCKIPVNKIDNAAYRIDFANGSFIELAGNASKAEREKLRGKDNSLYIVDEAQSQQGLGYLITSIIQPILKGRNGTLVLSGTGPIVAAGVWEQIINDPTWSKHTATMEDNPTIPSGALKDVLEENGWTEDNITYRREYLAEIAYDTNRLIVPVRSYFTMEDIKGRDFDMAILGMDYGYSDDNSFVSLVRDRASQKWYVVDLFHQNKMSSEQIVDKFFEQSKKLEEQWKIPRKQQYAVADTSHQQITRVIYDKGFYNISNAEKLGESQMLADMASDMASGRINIEKGKEVDTALNILSWKYDEERQAVIYEIDDKLAHDNRISDICDALKYAAHLTYRF